MDASVQFVPILIVGFATSLGMTPITRQIAMRLGVVAIPSKRNIHKVHMPLMGGLAIYVAFVLSVLLFSPPQYLLELGAIVAGCTLLAMIGFLDDRKDLSPRIRLIVMGLASLVVVVAGIQIGVFNTPLLDIPITIFWIMSLINAVNWLDNMDGLSVGSSAIAAGFFLLIAYTQGQILVSLLAAGLFGSAVGFLVYNFKPSSSFMGDMGAYTLGFVLAILGIKLNFSSRPQDATWMIPVLVLVLPVLDINSAILTRLMEGRSLLEAGKDHYSHRLRAVGFGDRQILFLLYGLCVLFGAMAWIVSASPPMIATQIGLFGVALMFVVFALFMWIRRRYQGVSNG